MDETQQSLRETLVLSFNCTIKVKLESLFLDVTSHSNISCDSVKQLKQSSPDSSLNNRTEFVGNSPGKIKKSGTLNCEVSFYIGGKKLLFYGFVSKRLKLIGVNFCPVI